MKCEAQCPSQGCTRKARGVVWAFMLLGSVVMLAACSTVPAVKTVPELENAWLAQRHNLDRLQSWTIAGRLGIQTESEGWHISFRWRQEAESYHIDLSAPLGQQSAALQGDSQGVTLVLADGRRVAAADPEDLLARQLGWRVPIKGLRYWVKGLPAPDAAEVHGLDERGRLLWLEQAGWRISYRRYGDFSGNLRRGLFFVASF